MNQATAQDRAHQITVHDPTLAAALRAVGIPEGQSGRIFIPCGDATGARFYFGARSECGKYSTKELIAAYRRGVGWIRENPEHPFAYAQAAARNLNHLIERNETGRRKVFARVGAGFLAFDEDLAPAKQDQLFEKAGL